MQPFEDWSRTSHILRCMLLLNSQIMPSCDMKLLIQQCLFTSIDKTTLMTPTPGITQNWQPPSLFVKSKLPVGFEPLPQDL